MESLISSPAVAQTTKSGLLDKLYLNILTFVFPSENAERTLPAASGLSSSLASEMVV
jgi:hypothetical protein